MLVDLAKHGLHFKIKPDVFYVLCYDVLLFVTTHFGLSYPPSTSTPHMSFHTHNRQFTFPGKEPFCVPLCGSRPNKRQKKTQQKKINSLGCLLTLAEIELVLIKQQKAHYASDLFKI